MDLTLLEKLTQTFGPSGYEDEIRTLIGERIEGYADEFRVDALGSLVAYRAATGGAEAAPQKLMLAAHMDEIGLMVTHIEEKGFLRFTSVGGVGAMNCIGGRATFANGVVGSLYVERREESSKVPELRHLYLDVGATDRESAPVRIGDPAVFVGPLVEQGNRLISKAMDDRIGCYVLIEVMRRLKSSAYDVYFVFTTQEEITLSGARTSAFRIAPDLAISIDVTATGDTPKALPMEVSLGQGPAIKVKDSGMIAHPKVRDLLVEAAERAGVPYQMEILLRGSTDAAAMQLVQAGVPSGCLSIPCRYVHSPSEMVDRSDVEQAVEMLLSLLSGA
ncbi:MAG: M42 family metallopeptidase [Anaerolineae bacterium]